MDNSDSGETRVRNFGHVIASGHGTAILSDVGKSTYRPGIELMVDGTVVPPAVLRSDSAPQTLNVELYEPSPIGELRRPRKLKTKISVWTEHGEREGGLRKLKMVLPNDFDISRLVSLASFAEQFWPGFKQQNTSPELAKQLLILDTLAQILFGVAEFLHTNNRTIGLMDPANILFSDSPGAIQLSDHPGVSKPKRNSTASQQGTEAPELPASMPPNCAQIQIYLPDLFLDSDRQVTDIPPWISVRQQFAFLWSDAAHQNDQSEVPGSSIKMWLDGQLTKFSASRDMRLLARMFSWALTGKKIATIPNDIVLRGGCWDVFREILNGNQPAVLPAIGERIASNPLAEQHLPAGERHINVGDSSGLRFAVPTVLLLLGIVAGVWIFRNDIERLLIPQVPTSPIVYSGCEHCSPDSKLHDIFRNELEPSVVAFHAEDRYPVPGDSAPVVGLTRAIIDEQETLLAKQTQVLATAQSAVGAEPSASPETEAACMESELRALLARIGQHFDFVAGRKISDLDTEERIIGLLKNLQTIDQILATEHGATVRIEVDALVNSLKDEDSSVRTLWLSYSEKYPQLETYFRLAALLGTPDRTKKMLTDYVKGYELYKKEI